MTLNLTSLVSLLTHPAIETVNLSSRQKKNAKRLESAIFKNESEVAISAAAYTDLTAPLPNSKETPLNLAISLNRVAVVKELLFRARERNQEGVIHSGLTYLFSNCPNKETLSGVFLSMLDLFLDNKGKLPCQVDTQGVPWGFHALLEDKLFLLKEIKSLGADLTLPNSEGDSLIHVATRVNARECLVWLLSDERNMNVINGKQETPLHIAVNYGNMGFIHLLINAGGNLFLKNDQGLTPLDLAEKSKEDVVVWKRGLIEKNLKSSLLTSHQALPVNRERF